MDLPGLLAVASGILDEVTEQFLAGMGAPSAVAKHGTDFATEMDLALERRIGGLLTERTGLGVHGEEFGGADVADGADMALVAGGALAGAVSYGRHPWDHAAGVVLVRAAGGVATDVHGRPWDVSTPSLVAAAPSVHDELMSVIADGDWPQPEKKL